VSLLGLSALLPRWAGTPEWLSNRVILCGAVALALLVLSLLLKGLQKVLFLLIIAVACLGLYWLAQDTWHRKNDVLPPQLALEFDGLARRVLVDRDAQAAWKSVQAEWSQLTGEAKLRLQAGGDEARAAVARRLDAKAAELRHQSKKAAAAEVAALRSKVEPNEN
jgi:hypothetical protein